METLALDNVDFSKFATNLKPLDASADLTGCNRNVSDRSSFRSLRSRIQVYEFSLELNGSSYGVYE